MQRAAPPQLVVQDELGRYSDGRPVANQLAVGQGSSPRRLPSPMGSPTLLPSPTSPRAASTLHLPPGPRFPLNPTAGRSGTPSTSSPPPPSSALADLLELVQDERAPAGRAFEPARATRGSVRLLSRGPDGSQAAGPSNGSTADAWVIPIYPFSEARAEAIMVAQPAQGPSVETRIAGSVPEATGPGSLTTRRTSETRTRFPQSGSAAVSLLFGSGARDGRGVTIQSRTHAVTSVTSVRPFCHGRSTSRRSRQSEVRRTRPSAPTMGPPLYPVQTGRARVRPLLPERAATPREADRHRDSPR
jgi:hypothetical protein